MFNLSTNGIRRLAQIKVCRKECCGAGVAIGGLSLQMASKNADRVQIVCLFTHAPCEVAHSGWIKILDLSYILYASVHMKN